MNRFIKKDKRVRRSLFSLDTFLFSVFVTASATGCCVTMFVKLSDLNFDIRDNINLFYYIVGNILFLSVLLSIIDKIKNKYSIKKPIDMLLGATRSIIEGDFSVRIKPLHKKRYSDEFDVLFDDFNAMARELESIELLRNDFISNVSHELKTPLAVITNYSTLLLDTQDDPLTSEEYIKTINTTSKYLSELITNILKLNKLENQQIFYKTSTFNLSEQICECMLLFENEWEKKNLDIDTDICQEIMIDADEELLRIVWNNLISNAIKFTSEGGEVAVSLKQNADGKIVFTITDSGCGIDEKDLPNIFEKFYQSDKSHSTKGNGLGLALVKRIVDISKGEIHVASEVGKGSTFIIVL